MLPNFEANWRTGTFRIAFSIIVTRIPMDHWFFLFGSRVEKIFIALQQRHLKLWLSYSVILRYLPTFLANQNIQKVFSAHINCCIALGGQVPILIQWLCSIHWTNFLPANVPNILMKKIIEVRISYLLQVVIQLNHSTGTSRIASDSCRKIHCKPFVCI